MASFSSLIQQVDRRKPVALGSRLLFLFALTLLMPGPASAYESGLDRANRAIPVPITVSPEIQTIIAAGPPPFWDDHPKTRAEWKRWVGKLAGATDERLADLILKMDVTVQPEKIAGVNVFKVSPNIVSERNQNRLLLNLHGGGYVLNPGRAGLYEAILMAGFVHAKVLAIDYRMPPDHPYPAALDDAIAVYKEVIKGTDPKRIAVFGDSAGGALTLALVLRAKAEGLPVPGAIAPGTPWSDLTETGDTYFTNRGIDNVLVRYSGWLGDAAALYANGHDPKDPMLSPVYGDFHGFPPAILTTGSRDLFLSNTLRVHRKMRDSGVTADLIVFEGLSHFQYLLSPDAPETKAHFTDLSVFFDKYLHP
ncbi:MULTISPECIES: alpha/beta hydrolase [Burkholderia]|uniref:alpha/beta hydrolase n=1 Tax=Burkholderia TaxID=32008 RepID=UPI001FC8CB38|nr:MULTISPECIES: alpha/beta hydrolase [Burkholderia]